jgi:hypothetical protein
VLEVDAGRSKPAPAKTSGLHRADLGRSVLRPYTIERGMFERDTFKRE